MKLAIITSTRPELIRLSKIINMARKYYDVTHIYTNQNFDASLSTQFFEEFDIEPDIIYDNDGYTGITFIGKCIRFLNMCLTRTKDNIKIIPPDAILILGDTNGAFAAASVAKRLGIPIFHMEAGNRCYDNKRVPEEINRRQIDAIADWHLCYTQRAREQLLLEGHHPSRCIVIGNPIYELLLDLFQGYSLDKKRKEDYILVTIHRKENLSRINSILVELNSIDLPVKISLHPSLDSQIEDKSIFKNIEFFTPTNFDDFTQLEFNAGCVVTDSGTIPEECSFLRTPCVLLRYSTERPELLENNSMIMCSEPEELSKAVEVAINENDDWEVTTKPLKVSNNVIKLIMRYNQC